MKKTGGEVIVQKLVNEKVPYILGIPGHGVLGLFDAIRKAEAEGKIKYMQVKHEQAATAIADGYYRVKGEPLAVFASIGPGTLNLSIGLATAFVDSTPFLALCGDTHTNMYGVGVLQEVEKNHDSNIQRALEPLVKRCWRAETADQLPRIMNNAFKEMLSGRRGPCAVTLPMDVQADSTEKAIPLSRQPVWTLPAADDGAVDKGKNGARRSSLRWPPKAPCASPTTSTASTPAARAQRSVWRSAAARTWCWRWVRGLPTNPPVRTARALPSISRIPN